VPARSAGGVDEGAGLVGDGFQLGQEAGLIAEGHQGEHVIGDGHHRAFKRLCTACIKVDTGGEFDHH